MSQRLGNGIAGLAAGILFGLGLSVAQMTDPVKVIAFLDVAVDWDPSLAFTMLGAILVSLLGYRRILHRGAIFSDTLHLPTSADIDSQLIGGAALFGIGWGMAGYCPGPAIAALAHGTTEPLVFLAALIAGSQIEKLWLQRSDQAEDTGQ